MNVVFVHSVERGPSLRKPMRGVVGIQLGISYISALLQQAGVQTSLMVLSSELEKDSLTMAREIVQERAPAVVTFSAVSTQYPFLSRIALNLKRQWPNLKLVMGGPHVSLNPGEALAGAFDVVCIGEGEYPFLEFVQRLQAGRPLEGIQKIELPDRKKP
jgi:anaerobic magnesium-protoporphyrin IX monomethyl ester cyclase